MNEIKRELEESEEGPRKKMKNPESWKVNLTKKAYNEGKAYISSSTKKLMPAKAMKESCGQNCRFKCENKVPEEARALFFSKYYSLDCKSKKYHFILQHVTEKKLKSPGGLSDEPGENRTPKKHFTRTYTIPVDDNDVTVCKTMFLNTLSISEKVARTIFQKLRSGESLSDKRGRFKKRKV